MQSHFAKLVGVSVWCLLLAVPDGFGSTVFVWSGGSNDEPYATWATAAHDVKTAVDYAAAEGIGLVQLTNDTFSVGSQITIATNITLRGESRDGTILLSDGDGHRALNVNHTSARVESLTVTNFYLSNGDGVGVYLNAGTLDDCLVTRNSAWNNREGIGVWVGAGGVVTNCVIRANYGRSSGNHGAVYIGSGGLVTHSVIESNTQLTTSGVYVNGGTLRWSQVVNNTARTDGESAVRITGTGAVVEFCTITNNVPPTSNDKDGGGVRMVANTTLRNSLIANNRATRNGGGVYMTGGLVESCTIARNQAANSGSSVGDGGGIYATGGEIRNTVIDENTAAVQNDNLRLGSATITYSCVIPKPTGDGNVEGPAGLADPANGDFTLLLASPARNAGTNQTWMTGAKDLTGTSDRIVGTIVDMGAFERPATIGIACDFLTSPSPAFGLTPLTVTFQAAVAGASDPGTLVYYWDFQDNGTWDESGLGLDEVTYSYTQGGVFDVRLTVSNATEQATYIKSAVATAIPSTMYVASGGSGTFPYASWTDAAQTINDAVAAAIDGVTIMITNETFVVPAVVSVTKGITLRGLDRDGTVISGNLQRRVFSVAHPDAVLETMTITQGRTNPDADGSGVYLTQGTLQDCTIRECDTWSNKRGVGVFVAGAGAVVTNCLITANDGRSIANYGAVYIGTGGLVTHSVISANTRMACGGAFVDGGALHWSEVINNTGSRAEDGTAVRLTNGGLVEFCTITNNVFSHDSGNKGGGVLLQTSGTVRNSLIADNRSRGYGGGVYMTGGLVESCTIVGNRAANGANSVGDGGGIYATAGTIRNTIIDENTSAVDNANLRLGSATISYSCIDIIPLPAGDGNKAAPAGFVNSAAGDYTLTSGSPARDSGTNITAWMTGATDLTGVTDRIINGTVDMGAYERDAVAELEVSFIRSPSSGMAPLSVTFQASVEGAVDPDALVYYWDFQDDGNWDESGLLLTNVTHVFGPGQYDVRLTVSNATENATVLGAASVTAIPETMYVASGGSGTFPYASWSDAAQSVGDAVNAAINGVTIVITNEIFIVPATVNVEKGITLRGLDRAGTILSGDTDRRVVRLAHANAVLETMTIEDGYQATGAQGAGVHVALGTLRDCTIRGSRIHTGHGAGVYVVGSGAVVSNCLITASSSGGTISDTHGAVYIGAGGLVTHSEINGNTGMGNTSGVYMDGGTLRRSLVINNSTRINNGEGAVRMTGSGALVTFCIITNNTPTTAADRDGGGVRMGSDTTLRNSLVAGNGATRHGGGVYMTGGLVESCTIARNRAANGDDSVGEGGGLYATGGTILNTIIDENTAAVDNDNLRIGTATITYSLADPQPAGAGNKAGPAGFVDSGSGDFTLNKASSAIDGGQWQSWMDGATDLSDLVLRQLGSAVDIGAYESEWLKGSLFLLR